VKSAAALDFGIPSLSPPFFVPTDSAFKTAV
jgi:hypothetical protein